MVFGPAGVLAITTIIGVYQSLQASIGGSWLTPSINAVLVASSYGILALVALLAWLSERVSEQSLEQTEKLLMNFLSMVSRIVDDKAHVLSSKAKTAKTAKKFNHVVTPEEQLRSIFSHGATFLMETFGLQADQLDITILQKKTAPGVSSGEWAFVARHQRHWPHGAPSALFCGTTSCAASVASGGAAVFHASKSVAASNDEYVLSDRDKRQGSDGSIYCDVVSIEDSLGNKWDFIVSIVTYGERFCDPFDEANELKTKTFLREIVRRIQIELHYVVIKTI